MKSGKLKALAIGSEKPVASLPNVSTVVESGLPGFVAITWFGVMAPPKTPPEIATRFSGAIAEALKYPDVQRRLVEVSAEPVGNTPAEMAGFMKDEVERWQRVIRSAGVKVD